MLDIKCMSSTISDGNFIIVAVVCLVFIIGIIAAIFISKKKKK